MCACECAREREGSHYTIICGSCHKYHFCRDKSYVFVVTKHVFVATKVCLPRQKFCLCRDKIFLLRQMFAATNTCLSPYAYFCRDKRRVLSRRIRVCRDKSMLIGTKMNFVVTIQKICRNERRVLWRQKMILNVVSKGT